MDEQKIKENFAKIANTKCICSSIDGLFVPNRQLSIVVSAGVALLFFSFVTGYFLAGQQNTEEFLQQVEYASLNDEMHASLCSLSSEAINSDVDVSLPSVINTEGETDPVALSDKDKDLTITEPESSQMQYYAQLIGFGTYNAAQLFVKKLEKKHILTEIKKHCSKTAKGKKVNWYQVITACYSDQEKLKDLVGQIEKTEKLKNTRIVAC